MSGQGPNLLVVAGISREGIDLSTSKSAFIRSSSSESCNSQTSIQNVWFYLDALTLKYMLYGSFEFLSLLSGLLGLDLDELVAAGLLIGRFLVFAASSRALRFPVVLRSGIGWGLFFALPLSLPRPLAFEAGRFLTSKTSLDNWDESSPLSSSSFSSVPAFFRTLCARHWEHIIRS